MNPLFERMDNTVRRLLASQVKKYEERWTPEADEDDALVAPVIILFAYTDETRDPTKVEFEFVPAEETQQMMRSAPAKTALGLAIRDFLTGNGAAVVVLSEAWAANPSTPEEERETREGDRSVGDLPNARTVFMAQLHLLDGTRLYLQPMKNGKADGDLILPDEKHQLAGRLSMQTLFEEARATAH